ncbi:MAG: O-antigen ligase family protein [Dehalococcoidia bacterium]
MSAVSYGDLAVYSPQQRLLLVGTLGLCLTLVGVAGIFLLGWITVVIVLAVAVSSWLIAKPRQGFYAILAAVLVVEGGSGLGFVRPLTFIYTGIDQLTGFGPPFALLDGAIILTALGLVRQAKKVRQALRFGEFFWPLTLLILALLFSWARGVNSGGDLTIGFHELRALFYVPLIYFIALNLMRDRRHLKELAVVVVVSILAVALGAISTHLSVVRPGTTETLDVVFLAHENALFAGVLVIMALASVFWGKEFKLRALFAAIGVFTLIALLVMKRRLGILALDAGVLILGLAMIKHNWKLSVVVLPILIVIGAVYVAAYWDATGGVGQGARSFRTAVGEEPNTNEDRSSDDYRDLETANVEANIHYQPFWGLGFGHEYTFVQELPDLTDFWPFQRYIPHNTVLWTWMKGGVFSFVLMLTLFGYAMIRSMRLLRRPMDPLLRAWAVTAAASVPMVFLFAWGDLGFTVVRTMMIFGLCLGLIAALGILTERVAGPAGAPPGRAGSR